MTIGDALWVLIVFFIIFLLQGDPSVWDVWQQSAKGMCK